MKLSIIVAMSQNRVIGRNGDLPWHLPEDLKRFKALTKGKAVIMGRKTYESIVKRIGKPLPDRRNIVISRDPDYRAEGCAVVPSLNHACRLVQHLDEEVFVIGGGQTYQQALHAAQRIYLTLVHTVVDGDVFFPAFEEDGWHETSRMRHRRDATHAHDYSFITYERAKEKA
ncbi:dihydrofolate reductase [Candidatus Azambacteria bacterium]|nr:dihydrofolate reductase [Candidatus Azambacteria bacterium]